MIFQFIYFLLNLLTLCLAAAADAEAAKAGKPKVARQSPKKKKNNEGALILSVRNYASFKSNLTYNLRIGPPISKEPEWKTARGKHHYTQLNFVHQSYLFVVYDSTHSGCMLTAVFPFQANPRVVHRDALAPQMQQLQRWTVPIKMVMMPCMMLVTRLSRMLKDLQDPRLYQKNPKIYHKNTKTDHRKSK